MVAVQRHALQLPPRRAAQREFKKRTISRAEGGQLQAPVQPRWRVYSPKTDVQPASMFDNHGQKIMVRV